MEKVGIATVHTGYNYGSSLQAYASKIILEELGYHGVNISLKGSVVKGRDIRIKKLAIIALRLLKQPFNIRKRMTVYKDNMSKPYSEESKVLFDKFRVEKIQPVQYTWNQIKMEANSDYYKAFLCGSDQIWNAEALYVDPQYYLRFAPKEKRIAFAPSFGRSEIADYNKKIIAKYIRDIPYISVREESGVNLIKKLTNQDAVHLIDPTLVLNSNQWDNCLNLQKNEELCEKKYILVYFLNEPSSFAIECIKKLSQDKKMEIISLPFRLKGLELVNTAPDAGPIEFVQYIKNASYVLTDSFHGTAFAVNYKIPFYTFERQYGSAGKQSARIISFLNLVSLGKHFNPTIDFLSNPVDFSKSIIVLEAERKKSLSYLKNNLKLVGEK